MKEHDFRNLADRCLSDLTWDREQQERMLRTLDEKEEKPMKKLSAGLALAIALMILTMAAGLATGGFGILDYAPWQANNQAYLDTILTLGKTYDLDAFSLTVNEAAFDGMRLLATMEIHAREGAEPVFVLPSVRAAIHGEKVETRWEGSRGFYTEAGFWVPLVNQQAPEESLPAYGGAEIALLPTTDGEGLGADRAASEPVEWEIVFDVYKPMMPLSFTDEDEPGMDEEPWTDEQYEAHERMLADAYDKGTILLDAYAEPWWYLSCIPQKDGIDGGEKSQAELWENAVKAGVFQLADEAVFRFETQPPEVRRLTDGPSLPLPDGFIAEVEQLDASVSGAYLRLRITREDGTPAAPFLRDFDWDFALLAEGADTSPTGSCLGPQEDGSLRFELQVELSAPAHRLTIVPCRVSQRIQGPDGGEVSQAYAVYMQQSPVTQEQRDCAVSVDLP